MWLRATANLCNSQSKWAYKKSNTKLCKHAPGLWMALICYHNDPTLLENKCIKADPRLAKSDIKWIYVEEKVYEQWWLCEIHDKMNSHDFNTNVYELNRVRVSCNENYLMRLLNKGYMQNQAHKFCDWNGLPIICNFKKIQGYFPKFIDNSCIVQGYENSRTISVFTSEKLS